MPRFISLISQGLCLSLLALSVGCPTQSGSRPSSPGVEKFPGHSLSSPMLQRDTFSQLIVTDKIAAGFAQVKCQDRTVVNTEVIEPPQDVRREGKRLLQGHWTERWTLNRCGSLILYRVAYVADGKAGISYDVTPDR